MRLTCISLNSLQGVLHCSLNTPCVALVLSIAKNSTCEVAFLASMGSHRQKHGWCVHTTASSHLVIAPWTSGLYVFRIMPSFTKAVLPLGCFLNFFFQLNCQVKTFGARFNNSGRVGDLMGKFQVFGACERAVD